MAEHLFRGRKGCQTRSAGILPDARVRLTEDLLQWADFIVFMDKNHQDYAVKTHATALAGKQTACWEVSNDYCYGDPDLAKVLEEKMRPLWG